MSAYPIPSVKQRRYALEWLAVLMAAGTVVVALLLGTSYALAGLGLLALGAVVLARPNLAAVAVVFALFSNAAPVAVRSYGIPYTLAVSFFLLLFVPAAYYVAVRGEAVRRDTVLALMSVFLLVQVASVLFSRHAEDSWTPLQSFAMEGVLLYVLMLNAVRNPQALRQCLRAMVLAGALLGGLSLLQNATGDYGNQFGGFALTRTKNALGEVREARMTTVDASGRVVTRPRSMGPIGDPNYYGQLLTMVLGVGLPLIWAERRRRSKVIVAMAAGCVMGGIAVTYSRGAALAAGSIFLFLIALRYVKWRYALPALVAGYLLLSLAPDYASRLRSLTAPGSGDIRAADRSVQERATLVRAGTAVFRDYPLLGVGVGQARHYISSYATMGGYSRVRRFKAAHNTYLELLVETGIVGLLAFLALVGGVVYALWRARTFWRERRPEYAHQATGLLLAVLGFLVSGFFLDLAYARFFWGLLALSGAAACVFRKEALVVMGSRAAATGGNT